MENSLNTLIFNKVYVEYVKKNNLLIETLFTLINLKFKKNKKIVVLRDDNIFTSRQVSIRSF